MELTIIQRVELHLQNRAASVGDICTCPTCSNTFKKVGDKCFCLDACRHRLKNDVRLASSKEYYARIKANLEKRTGKKTTNTVTDAPAPLLFFENEKEQLNWLERNCYSCKKRKYCGICADLKASSRANGVMVVTTDLVSKIGYNGAKVNEICRRFKFSSAKTYKLFG